MKLFCDDLRMPPDDSWTVARTVTEAIRMLHTMRFDEISLDHDIGGSEETFMPVAMYIAARYGTSDGYPSAKAPRVIIHSGNPVGAENMYLVLKDAGIMAYTIPPQVKEIKQ